MALRKLPRLSDRDARILEVMGKRLVSKLMAPRDAFVKQRRGSLSEKERMHLLESVFGNRDGD